MLVQGYLLTMLKNSKNIYQRPSMYYKAHYLLGYFSIYACDI